MLVTFFRALILYIIVLIVMRFMGKREIAQLQPFELAISILIADLAAVPMAESGIPLIRGIIPIFTLLFCHMIISLINMKSIKLRGLICGKPSILIYRGKIQEKALRKERYTINELEEKLRGNNVNNLGDVEYAILETSGQISVVLKPEKRLIVTSDLNIDAKYEGLSYDLVIDGKILYENLKRIGKDENWLKKEIAKFKINYEDTLIASIDGAGNMFVQGKEKK